MSCEYANDDAGCGLAILGFVMVTTLVIVIGIAIETHDSLQRIESKLGTLPASEASK